MIIFILIILKTLGIILISALAIGITVCLLIYFKFKSACSITGKTIHIKNPIALSDIPTEREPVIKNEISKNLISKESYLRRSAYKNTTIKTDESFFDDSDMKSDYYLIIIYDKKSNTSLLSARYYFDKSVIKKYLKGDDYSEPRQADLNYTLNIDKYKEGEIFLIDRMSSNNYCSVYRKNRNYIHLLFYLELLKHNKNCKFMAMARKEKYEKLLTKYLRLGLRVIGSAKHKGKEHWILLGDLKKSYSQLKMTTIFNIILMSKFLLYKYK